LRGRIADYYEAGGGSRDLDSHAEYECLSAAFVSFASSIRGDGGPIQVQFSHSVYVRAAIANADANRGVSRDIASPSMRPSSRYRQSASDGGT